MIEKWNDVMRETPPDGVPPVRFPGAELILNDEDPKQPPAKKVIRLNEAQLKELRIQLQYYLDKGMLRPSSSDYAAPVFFVPKPHTSPVKWRMAVDYRLLNSITRRDGYPLPAADSVIDAMRGSTVFSKIDLTQFFHQIPVHPDSIRKTAITTRYGNYEWTVCPFGIHNCPPLAQRLMHTIFRDYLDIFMVVFMDDILIFSKTVEEHKEHLDKVFERMREQSLYAHPEKVELYRTEMTYLGYGLNAKGVYITDESKEAISNWDIPKPNAPNKKGNRKPNPDGKTAIRTFLGMASFFRRFIPKLAERAKPISDMLDPDTPFDWGEKQQAAFDDIKRCLLSDMVLQTPDPSKKFYIYPDASLVGVGAVLMQVDVADPERKRLKACAFMSKKLNATEFKWGTYEKELWAMILSLMKWKHYIIASPVEIRTDHQSLKWFKSQGKLTDKVIRWLDFMSEFDYSIVHIPRDLNVVADAFSKTPKFYEEVEAFANLAPLNSVKIVRHSDSWFCSMLPKYVARLNAVVTRSKQRTAKKKTTPEKPETPKANANAAENADEPSTSSKPRASERVTVPDLYQDVREAETVVSRMDQQFVADLKASYTRDKFAKNIIENIERYPNYVMLNDLLYRRDLKHARRLYVPELATVERFGDARKNTVTTMRRHLLLEFHEHKMTGGHQGVQRTLKMLSRYFWWPTIRKDVEYHVKTCERCQRTKAYHLRPPGVYKGWKPSLRKWNKISIDFITGLPETMSRNNAIFVVLDSTSRRVILIAVNMSINATQTAKLMFDRVVSQHGLPQSILSDNDVRFKSVWQKVFKSTGTDLNFTPSYHPIANSANERSHQVIEDFLRSYVVNVKNVKEWDEQLPACEFCLNNHENTDTKRTPFELDAGQHPLDPISVQFYGDQDGVLEDWQFHSNRAVDLYRKAQELRLSRINKNRIYPAIKAGDMVMLSTEHLKWAEKTARGSKLTDRWIGPFPVKSVAKNKLSVTLNLEKSSQWTFWPIVPVNRVKPYHKDRRTLRDHEQPPTAETIEGDEYFEVESIVDQRFNKRTKSFEFRVKFLGYEESDNRWIPERELADTCTDLLREYKELLKQAEEMNESPFETEVVDE